MIPGNYEYVYVLLPEPVHLFHAERNGPVRRPDVMEKVAGDKDASVFLVNGHVDKFLEPIEHIGLSDVHTVLIGLRICSEPKMYIGGMDDAHTPHYHILTIKSF